MNFFGWPVYSKKIFILRIRESVNKFPCHTDCLVLYNCRVFVFSQIQDSLPGCAFPSEHQQDHLCRCRPGKTGWGLADMLTQVSHKDESVHVLEGVKYLEEGWQDYWCGYRPSKTGWSLADTVTKGASMVEVCLVLYCATIAYHVGLSAPWLKCV